MRGALLCSEFEWDFDAGPCAVGGSDWIDMYGRLAAVAELARRKKPALAVGA